MGCCSSKQFPHTLKPHLSIILYNGEVVEKYENGNIRSKINFVDGLKEGLFEYWFENGQMHFSSVFRKDKMISFREWNQMGNLIVDNDNELEHKI